MSWRVKLTIAFGFMVAWLSTSVVREVRQPWAVLFAGGCLLALGAAAVLAWHHARTLEYRDRLAPLEGWEKVGPQRWRCPDCACEVTGWKARKHHATAPTSPCAVFQQHLADATDALKEALPGAGWPQVIEGEPDELEAVES